MSIIAKTKYLGNIIEVERIGDKYYSYNDDDYSSYDEDDLEIITDKPYWENLEHQYIGQFTAALLSNPKIIEELVVSHNLENKHEIIADLAIDQTKILISKIKKE